MTDKASRVSGRVSFDKGAGDTTVNVRGRTPAGAPSAARPRQAGWVLAALIVSGLAALGSSLSLYGLHSFLLTSVTRANDKLKASDRKSPSEVAHAVSQVPLSNVIQSAVFLLALLFVGRAVWRGRYWARWAVIGLWVLSLLTRVSGSPVNVLYIVENAPVAFKLPATISSLAFIVAVVITFAAKPLVAWLNLSRPAGRTPAGGAAPARRGMFAPRVPPAPRNQSAAAGAPVDRARAKQRVSAEVPLPAAPVTTRARSSKSRRSGS